MLQKVGLKLEPAEPAHAEPVQIQQLLRGNAFIRQAGTLSFCLT